ncbi:C-type polyheme cytochrome OmcC [Anaerolineales bacterium]|nr:C-type polyheme cytochrome OmcC [Anaerolineales bacterium]
MTLKKILILAGTLILAAVVLAACGGAATEAPVAVATEAPTKAPPPTATPVPTVDPAEAIMPIFAASGHADGTAEAFVHWDDVTANPDGIPVACAKCHSEAGFVDFIADGKVDAAVPAPGAAFTCAMCHNDAADKLTSVTFPSGAVIENLGPEARCMTCHQGRESKVSLDKKLAAFGENLDPDAMPAPYKDDKGNDVKLSFSNVHYFAAGGTLYGSQVQMGYQYDGKTYDAKHQHVDGFNTCLGCHDSHSLEVKVETCTECHADVAAVEDLKNIREPSSAEDYDGDGDKTEGVAFEIQGLQETLLGSMQAYALEVAGAEIKYDGATYPYFMGADGKAYPNWTPRLLKAAYNYQVSVKDPGAFAHGGKYIIELLVDSIEDVNSSAKLKTKFDTTVLTRNDAGHFDGSAEAWRHWDGEEAAPYVVPVACAKCHSGSGLPTLLAGGTIPEEGVPAGNGLMCVTCHDGANFPARYAVKDVTMPSGKVVSFGEGDDSNLCLQCHQGRESKASVDKTIAAFNPTDMDVVPAPYKNDQGKDVFLGFKNIHYFPAGVTIFGTEAQGAYEFDGKTYVGMSTHAVTKCGDCHEVHALEIDVAAKCATCHAGATDVRAIRMAAPDYDGDGDITESASSEFDGLREALYTQIKAYTKAKGLDGIVYNAAAYPYWFADKDGNGEPDKNDTGGNIGYSTWSPNLLKAAFNYQYATKDPGAFAHNPKYVAQILIDSIEVMGGDVTKYVRP